MPGNSRIDKSRLALQDGLLLHGVSCLGSLCNSDQGATWTRGGAWINFVGVEGGRGLFLNKSIQIGSRAQVNPCRVVSEGISFRVRGMCAKMDGRSDLMQSYEHVEHV